MTWIVLSDWFFALLGPDVLAAVSPVKGVIYVLVTASLLWVALLLRDLGIARSRGSLAASEERYRMLAERAQDVVYRMRLGPTPEFEYVSPSIEALTGHTPEEHYADPALGRDVVHPDDLGRLVAASVTGTLDEPVLVRLRGLDGRYLWTEHRVTVIRDAAGAVIAVEGAARDVTARVRADERGAMLARVVEATPLGVGLIGGAESGFELTYVNEAMAGLVGVDRAELLGRSAFSFHERGGPQLTDELVARLAGGEPFEVSTAMTHDGVVVPMSLVVSPILAASGDVEAVLTFLTDRSETVALGRAEGSLAAVLDASPMAVVAVDLHGIVTAWNRAAERVFGWSADETVGRLLPYLDTSGWEGTAERRAGLIDGTADPDTMYPMLRKDGSSITCQASTGVERDEHGRAVGFVTLATDLTESMRRDEWSTQLRRAIDHSAESILVTDLKGTITYVNPAVEATSGYRADELLGRNPRILASGLTSKAAYAEMWRHLTAGTTWRGVLVNRRKDGSLYEEEVTLSAVPGADGRPSAYVGVKRDLTLERRLSAGLSAELLDRAAVEEAMGRIEVRETPEATAGGIVETLMAFPEVDGAWILWLPRGRAACIPLASLVTSLPIHVGRPIDPTIASYVRERAQSGAWADNHRDARVDRRVDVPEVGDGSVVAAPIRYRGHVCAVLLATARAASGDAWIARHLRIVSELAAHVAPLLGPQLEAADRTTATDAGLREIIDRRGFSPVFQPVCDLTTRRPVGWEALSRFDDGTPPLQRFIEARSLGLGDDLELATGRRAVEAFAELGRTGWLSINVSPSLVMSGRAGQIVEGPVRQIVLELTEATSIDDCARLRGAIDLLVPRVLLAVDDPGAGYASFRHVLELRPDFVKLPPSFVRGLELDQGRQALVAGMVHYASEAGSRIVGLGIENEAERQTLVRLGIHLGQGFLLGSPSATGDVARRPSRDTSAPWSLRAVQPVDDAGSEAG
ncbi:MAG: PAS domain S-box protein [Chloroflexota bacterium]